MLHLVRLILFHTVTGCTKETSRGAAGRKGPTVHGCDLRSRDGVQVRAEFRVAELQRREQNKLAEERQKELLLGLKSEEEKLEKVRAKKTAKRRAKKEAKRKAKGAKSFKTQESKLRDSLEQVLRTSQ